MAKKKAAAVQSDQQFLYKSIPLILNPGLILAGVASHEPSAELNKDVAEKIFTESFRPGLKVFLTRYSEAEIPYPIADIGDCADFVADRVEMESTLEKLSSAFYFAIDGSGIGNRFKAAAQSICKKIEEKVVLDRNALSLPPVSSIDVLTHFLLIPEVKIVLNVVCTELMHIVSTIVLSGDAVFDYLVTNHHKGVAKTALINSLNVEAKRQRDVLTAAMAKNSMPVMEPVFFDVSGEPSWREVLPAFLEGSKISVTRGLIALAAMLNSAERLDRCRPACADVIRTKCDIVSFYNDLIVDRSINGEQLLEYVRKRLMLKYSACVPEELAEEVKNRLEYEGSFKEPLLNMLPDVWKSYDGDRAHLEFIQTAISRFRKRVLQAIEKRVA